MGFLHAVCPRESEYLLHLSELSAQIVEAVRRTSSDAAFVHAVEQEASKVAPISPAVLGVVHRALCCQCHHRCRTVVITGATECATAGGWGVPDSAARGQRGAERQHADAGGDGHAAA